jgi:phosphoenolpyruvate carboxykinase (ATP)
VPEELLWQRNTWEDKAAYDEQAGKLARMFAENFRRFEDGASETVRAACPRAD